MHDGRDVRELLRRVDINLSRVLTRQIEIDGDLRSTLRIPSESAMPTSRFEPSAIRNKIKREEVIRKNKKAKTQAKLQKRLAQAKLEASDPAAKKVRLKLSFP
jgi:hypothetical protein